MRFGHGFISFFLFLCVLVWSCSQTAHCQILPQNEVEALKKIGAKLGKHWDFTVNPCSGTSGWVDPLTANEYVKANVTCGTCKENYCHVTSIVLNGQNLTGSLPDEFSNLTFLQFIYLEKNYLNGTIPAAWASLPLIRIALGGNRITGRIPDEIGRITTLQQLYLGSNLIEGPLPQSLGNLTKLNELGLKANAITGRLPESLGNLKNITYFFISGNPITGKIPSFIGNWTQLYQLDMQGTSLEGPFPPVFSTLQNIRYLEVSDLIGGDGKFPPLQNMTRIVYLILRNMLITDKLPPYIGNMISLGLLDLSFNAVTGQIPNSLKSLKYLNYLFLNNNQLVGAIPDWMLTSGIHIDLSYNNFDAPNAPSYCSTGIVNMVSSYSSTDDNSIKPCLRRKNPCSGIPTNYNLFINCGGHKIIVDENEYQDNIDREGASYYNSYGEKWALSSTGYLSSENQSYIATNVSPIAAPSNTNSELYTTARLSSLSLTYYGLCLLNGNYEVNLHFAEIMFTDDQTYSAVGRRFFDVSIQGERVLRDFNIAKEANGTGRAIIKSFSATVNSNTLEIHFQWAGKGTQNIPQLGVYGPLISAISVTPNFKLDTGENHELPKRTILGTVAGGCVVIVLVSVFIFFFFLRRKDDENKELRGLELRTGIFTLKQIKVATRNFDPANKLGEGGFGPVYKGVLSDGSLIAVKQLSTKSRQGNREFINEIGIISALQHPNLVRLFGCCIEANQLLLIYEFMENNSLANALFGPEKDKVNLDWPTRYRICLHIARGLAYLHEETRLKIVHRDIKATNVLLDKDLNAKISDFGLAKLSDEDVTHISTRIAGTIGYMAPEYAMRGYLTDKADVYSFGVVILETVSGLSNANYRPKEDCVHLLDWAYILQEQGRLVELVDKSLGPNYSEEEAVMLLNLALTCTSSSPSLRPTMPAVVNIIGGKKPVPVLSRKGTGSNSSLSTWFEAFEILSDNNSQLVSSSTYHEPWMESSMTTNVEEEEDIWISSKSMLISD